MIMSVPRYANVHTKMLIKQQVLVYKFTMAMELAKFNLNRVLPLYHLLLFVRRFKLEINY